MKKLFITTLAILFLLLFFACSEKDEGPAGNNDQPDPPEPAQTANFEFTFPDDTELADYVSEIIVYNDNDVTAYSLDQFVDLDNKDIDEHYLYAFQVFASDGFSARDKGYSDLNWDEFQTGYYLPSINDGRVYFPDESIPSAFNVKEAETISLYRKIDVILAGTTVMFEIGGLTTESVSYNDNDELVTYDGISMPQFISDYITENPENYEYLFIPYDDYGEMVYQWQDIQNAYWIPEKDRVVFLEGQEQYLTNFKYLYSITLSEIQ